MEPDRVQWGRALNGIDESDESVVRLTLKPGPSKSGDVVLQLAKPTDGSNEIQMVTYDTNSNMNGNNRDLT
ncbi:hypothetical protein SynPROS71_01879 [Synechococcus sp. PROS-7-1]|uniref:hypothetical protein n=1 Tax=Synechococcus sp. PROS-7-1 TaxID=1442556 RepID=UPI001647F053|nr:hypothetical protein [Synechococcus sp. PROS-7-1]QNI85660.1 hypothetical protein SynPROS71_01879 [Synechococcus sp. PROS-7-1]